MSNLINHIFNKKIGFVGVGQMGTALLISFSDLLKKYNNSLGDQYRDIFYLCEKDDHKLKELLSRGFKNIYTSEEEVYKNCKIIFLCVKPDSIEETLKKNYNFINSETLIISIAAGISISYLESLLERTKAKIIRIMTNHLCTILESASVYSVNQRCTTLDEEIIFLLLKGLGIIKKIEEKQMNVFTALTGSGPAFIYYFIECLSDAALKNGLDIKTAREFAIQVLYGSAKFLKNEKNNIPNSIKYIVTTPNGTTIAGLSQMEKHRFKWAISEAITHATLRANEIEIEKMKKFSKTNF